MKTAPTMMLALALAGFTVAQPPPGEDLQPWEIEKIERKIQLTLDFEQNIFDRVGHGPDVYEIIVRDSSPRPPYRELEEILRTYLADYVTVLERDYSFILGRKTAKSAAPEYLVELAKHAPPVTVVPLADRKITKIIKIQKKKYGYNRIAEFLYDFVPHVPGLALKRELKGMIEYGSDRQEQILVIHGVLFEDQGVLEFKKNQ